MHDVFHDDNVVDDCWTAECERESVATAFGFLDTSAEAPGDFFSELNVVFNVGFGDQAFVVGSSIQE